MSLATLQRGNGNEERLTGGAAELRPDGRHRCTRGLPARYSVWQGPDPIAWKPPDLVEGVGHLARGRGPGVGRSIDPGVEPGLDPCWPLERVGQAVDEVHDSRALRSPSEGRDATAVTTRVTAVVDVQDVRPHAAE